MNKNRKLLAYGMTAAAILSMTACAAGDKTVEISFADNQAQETQTANDIITEENLQETATASLSSANETAQDLTPASLSPTNEETQEPKTKSQSPANEEAQESKMTLQSPANEDTQTSETDDIYLIFDNPVYLEDYYNTPEGKAAIDADFADLAGEGMSVEIDAVMDEIIVTVKYEDSSLLTDGIEEKLTQQLDSMTDRFWKRTIAYDQYITWRCILTVRYTDAEGNILAKQSYSAE